jgi:transglutaminase-like putative cysteine protease
MNRNRVRALAVAASLASILPAAAQVEQADPPTRIEMYHATYVINPDGSSAATYEKALKILRQQALESGKQAYVSYSTSVERAEILEAYTRKPDGRRVDAPKSNYQLDINKGHESDSPSFSDRTQLSVIFPDVAVDDVVVFRYRITDIEAMFPGHFSTTERFSRGIAFDDVKVRFDAPASLWTQYAATDMTQSVDEVKDGRRVVEWTWKNPAAIKSKRRDYSAFNPDKEPGYSFSTFRGYGEIAEAYGSRARPRAAATERVRLLAEEITEGKNDPKEQAKALYEWVATNINFAGNCVGVGAVVPREQAFVLDNKMGDCKDHATLLQALLSAKGIVSTQALVNSGSTYNLPKVPVLSMVNHVIVYVPSQDLFLDSTSSDTPFGMLPMGDSDKPVLLVDGYKDGLRTPPIRGEANRQLAKTEVTIKPDGSIAGTVEVSSHGTFAVSGRDRLRNLSQQDREEAMKNMYQGEHKRGFGRLVSDDPKPLLDSFKYNVKFETEDFTQVPGPGAFTIQPLYMTEAPIHMVGAMTEDEQEAEETACFGGSSLEEYVYHLPKGMKVLAVPKGVTVANAAVTYKSSYVLKGGTLTVKRELVDRTNRNVCPVSTQREFAKLARKVTADLKAQVVYQ